MKNNFKKLISVVLAVVLAFSVLGVIGNAATLKTLDLAFVVDTTASMGGDIYQAQQDMRDHLNQLEESDMDYRIAIVDYRDFAERTGDYDDYPYCVQLDFTNDYDAILNAINSLTLGYGGDTPETVCSALIDGLSELSWRDKAGKAAILMGDAPALDPEPITNYTKDMAIDKLLNDSDIGYKEDMYGKKAVAGNSKAAKSGSRSAVTLFTIATSNNSDTIESFEYLAQSTGGKSYTAADSTDITEIISEIIEEIPDVVEDNEKSFWDLLWDFFKTIWYVISFQWDKI